MSARSCRICGAFRRSCSASACEEMVPTPAASSAIRQRRYTDRRFVVSSETGSASTRGRPSGPSLFSRVTSKLCSIPGMAHTPTTPPTSKGTFQPYVPATQSPAEFTVRAVILGVLFGLIFGASTVYLGLRAGLTVSASIPIAGLAISVLKKFGGSTILENNIVQTIGSAGESVAGGVVFTVPALIFLAPYGPGFFSYFQILMLAFAGGILGVLMMVPLRRALIIKEHGVLPYPEGAACADVLIAGERGGALAKTVFSGLGVGAIWKAVSWIVQIFRTDIGYSMSRASLFPNATLNVDISPEYMGVGYVIGPRIAGVMFAAGA